MPTKVLSLDLTELTNPIHIENSYDSLFILIRQHYHLINRIWLDIPPNTEVILPAILQQEITSQLGWHFVEKNILTNITTVEVTSHPLQPISIIICTSEKTQIKSFERCLQSLSTLSYPQWEIIVIHSGSKQHETRRMASKYTTQFVVEDIPGLNQARNRGITEAHFSLIAFIEDSVEVDHFWLQRINQAFEASETVAVTGLGLAIELVSWGQIIFELDYGGFSKGWTRQIFHRDHLSPAGQINSPSWGSRVNMAFRREILDKLGGFRTEYDQNVLAGSGGEWDLFHRLVMEGFQLIYDPTILVWYTPKRYDLSLKNYLHQQNCAFGYYLLTCWRDHSVSTATLLKFCWKNYLNPKLRRRGLRSRYKIPCNLVILEIRGFFSSLFLFKQRL